MAQLLSNTNAPIFGASYMGGLYAVTPDILDTALLCQKVEAALKGGASLLQYRNKAVNHDLRLRQATALLALCRSYKVPLIINDHLDLCAQIDADGLHLGATDCDLSAARRLLGADKIIGASCYNRLELAEMAQAQGASYVAFGACFVSSTKPNAVKADLNLFQSHLNIPKVAIGGINLQNVKQVVAAGANAVAIISDLFEAPDIAEQARRYKSLIQA